MALSSNSLFSDYLTKHELARELRRSTRTLDRWHVQRIGPARTRAGKTILYSRRAVTEWLQRNEETVLR